MYSSIAIDINVIKLIKKKKCFHCLYKTVKNLKSDQYCELERTLYHYLIKMLHKRWKWAFVTENKLICWKYSHDLWWGMSGIILFFRHIHRHKAQMGNCVFALIRASSHYLHFHQLSYLHTLPLRLGLEHSNQWSFAVAWLEVSRVLFKLFLWMI